MKTTRKRKPTVAARLRAIEEALVSIVQSYEDLPVDLLGGSGGDVGGAAEWLGEWLAMKSEELPKLKIGWGSERVNRRRKR